MRDEKTLIEIMLLPDKKKYRFKEDEVPISEILEALDIDDIESVAIVVNGRLISDLDYVVKEKDKIVLIKQATGGI